MKNKAFKKKPQNGFFLFLTAYILIILSPYLCYSQTNYVKETLYMFDKNLVIGDATENIDYLFGLPSAVLTDLEGNIFVSDDKYGSIRVYNNRGKFLFQFGKNGRGPGEFLEVTSMTVMDNSILIFDFYQQRFTLFTNGGELLWVKNAPKGLEIKPDYMRYIKDYGIVLFYRKKEGLRGNLNNDKDYLLHVVSEDFSEIKYEFGPITHTIDTSDPFESYFEGGVYRGIFVTTDSSLYLAPFFYRGKILVYESNQDWKLDRVLKGYTETSRTYEGFSDYKKVLGKGFITNSANYGQLAGIMKNESLALFKKENGNLLHIGLLEIGDSQKLYVTIFNPDGELLAHGKLEGISAGLQKNDYYRRLRFYWLDKNDHLYIIDYGQENFTIIKGQISKQ